MYVGFLLDETGSMQSIESATVSGFNEYIKSLKDKKIPTEFHFSRFNTDKYTSEHEKDVNNVKDLTDYKPAAMTNLYDSIARIVKDIEAHTVKGNVLVVVMTDGAENASREFDRTKIFDLIKRKEKDGWTFLYLGANQDAWQQGAMMGTQTANTVNFTADAAGIKTAFYAASSATSSYSMNTRSGNLAGNDKLFNVKHVDDLKDPNK
jgi:hypothetical protein